MRTSVPVLLCACVYLTSPATTQEGPAVIRVVVEEGRDAILPCSINTGENIEETVFDWKKDDQKEVFFHDVDKHYNNGHHGQDEHFKGRVFHFQDELKHGNASIIIRNTKISDSGNYTCHFPHLQPNGQTFYIKLVVEVIVRDRSREIKGAAPKPYTRILDVTKDGVLLQCEVHGASPKPEVEWQDSAGNTLTAEEPQVTERGGSYDIILNTTVTKSDHVRCVVKQKGINHEISAETYVPVPGAAPKPYTENLDVTEHGALLQCEVLGAFPKPEVKWQDSNGNTLTAEEPQVTERGGSYDIILLTTVTKSDHVRCVVKQKGINHEISAGTYVSVPEKRCEVWAGWFFGGWGSGVLTLAAVLALLVFTKCIKISRINKGSPPQTNGSCTRYSQVPPQPESHQNGSPPQANGSCNGSSDVPLKIQLDS